LLGNLSIMKVWKKSINTVQLLVSKLINLTYSVIWRVFRAHKLVSRSQLLPESAYLC